MTRPIACIHCGASVPVEEVRAGWCESCGKAIPRSAVESWPDAGQRTEAVRPTVRTPGAGEKTVAGGFVHTRLWGYCCPACGKDRIFADGPASVLDRKYFWKCDDCGKLLGTTRPFALSLAYLGVCLVIIVVAATVSTMIVSSRLADSGQQDPGNWPKVTVFGLGMLVGGSLGVWLVLKDLSRAKPKKVPTMT